MGAIGKGDLNNPYWGTWGFQSWNNEKTYELIKRYTRRPKEQLYDSKEDPYEMANLASDQKIFRDQGFVERQT